MHILEKIIHQTINMYMLMLWTKYVLSTLEITIIRRYLSSFPLICLTFLTNFDQCRELVSYNHIMYTKHYTTKQCMYFLFILERCSTATTNMSNSKSPHATTLETTFTHLKWGSFHNGGWKKPPWWSISPLYSLPKRGEQCMYFRHWGIIHQWICLSFESNTPLPH